MTNEAMNYMDGNTDNQTMGSAHQSEHDEGSISFIIQSKVRSYIQEQQGFNISADFLDRLHQDIQGAIDEAVIHAQKLKRKTLMGKDFNFYKDDPQISTILVVASKIKRYVKEKAQLNCSAQVMEQLTVRIHRICQDAIKNTLQDKRKTVLGRDFVAPTATLTARN